MREEAETGRRARRGGEVVGLLFILAAVPLAIAGLALSTNHYAWMAAEGAIPPDCTQFPRVGFFLATALVFLGGLVGFGRCLLRRRSRIALIGASLSGLMLVVLGLKLPSYLREYARAEAQCSK